MKRKLSFCLAAALFVIAACKEIYLPPEIAAPDSILVVEGFINVGADTSTFKLSRSRALGSTTTPVAETKAQLKILNEAGNVVAQSVERSNGEYKLGGQTSANENYRLQIVTSNGKEYLSDLVLAKKTPAITSVTWRYDSSRNGIQFFASTNDPTNNTRYYRWENEQTWEYRAYFNSILQYENNAVVDRTAGNNIYQCWAGQASTKISIGTSERLTEDRISEAPVELVSGGDRRFNVRHSILVKQYALTKEAYRYWQTLQKMTEQGGTIFDQQPTQLLGNITCTTNPDEPVIGYLSAHTEEQKRIFINHTEVPPSFIVPYPAVCEFVSVPGHPDSLRLYYVLRNFIPVMEGLDGAFESASPACADCRVYGGSNVRPAFW